MIGVTVFDYDLTLSCKWVRVPTIWKLIRVGFGSANGVDISQQNVFEPDFFVSLLCDIAVFR